MKPSGIGGQAVMEGIMMKHEDKYAVAIRMPDTSILVETKEFNSICKNESIRNIPMLRGIINFVDSLVLGMGTLTFSASFFEEEDKDGAASRGSQKGNPSGKSKKKEKAEMGFAILLSVLLAVSIFMVLPYYLSQLFQQVISSRTWIIIIEGLLRLGIFVIYILLISRMKDIQRVFMYHGAEHKCINCIEHGLELTLENVRKSPRQHRRCGTSFLFFVIIVSIIVTMFIRVDSGIMRLLLRLIMLPFIAGISYEIIRLAGKSENPVISLLSRPGLWMQGLTTKEPDDEMIEIGIASVEAIFDWNEFIVKMKEGVV